MKNQTICIDTGDGFPTWVTEFQKPEEPAIPQVQPQEQTAEDQNELLYEIAEIASKRLVFKCNPSNSTYQQNLQQKMFDASKDKWQFDALGFIRELKEKGYEIRR